MRVPAAVPPRLNGEAHGRDIRPADHAVQDGTDTVLGAFADLVTRLANRESLLAGGWIGRHVGFLPVADPGPGLPSLESLLTATVGALVVLALWKWLRR